MDYIPPGFSVNGILQARILEFVAIPFSRGSSWLRDQTRVSCIAGRFFTIWATREELFFLKKKEHKNAHLIRIFVLIHVNVYEVCGMY